ncbi:MAG: adenylyl-sulfate kinase [archaeon]
MVIITWEEICEEYRRLESLGMKYPHLKNNLEFTQIDELGPRGTMWGAQVSGYNICCGNAFLEWGFLEDGSVILQNINKNDIEKCGPLLVLGAIYCIEKFKKNELKGDASLIMNNTYTKGIDFFARFFGFKASKKFREWAERNGELIEEETLQKKRSNLHKNALQKISDACKRGVEMTFCIWLTGLPGSGKSTIAKKLVNRLENEKVQVLRMDEFRKILTPNPKYNTEERDVAYRAMVLIGKYLHENGISVIFDATGHKREWRELARKQIPGLKEVYIECPLKVAMQREANRKQNLVTKDLYEKAIKRQKGEQVELRGEVIGVDVEYEAPENPELVIDVIKLKPKEAVDKILELINK